MHEQRFADTCGRILAANKSICEGHSLLNRFLSGRFILQLGCISFMGKGQIIFESTRPDGTIGARSGSITSDDQCTIILEFYS